MNWNTSLYKTAGEAASSDQNNGLIVLGIMLKVGKANSELAKIIPSLYDVPLKGQKANLKQNLAIQKLFPSNQLLLLSNVSYTGSFLKLKHFKL